MKHETNEITQRIPCRASQLAKRDLAITTDASMAAIVTPPNKVVLINLNSKTITAEIPIKNPTSVCFLNSNLFCSNFDGEIIDYNIELHQITKRLEHDSPVPILSIRPSSDESMLIATTLFGYAELYPPSLDQQAQIYNLSESPILSLLVGKDSTVITTHADGTMAYWNTNDINQQPKILDCHSNEVLASATYKNLVITGGKDETLKFWKKDTGQELCAVFTHSNSVFEITVNPVDNTFASCDGDGRVIIWRFQ